MNVRNPRWADAAKSAVDVTLEHPAHGEIDCTCRADDPATAAIYAAALAGELGNVAAYAGPSAAELAGLQRRREIIARLAAIDADSIRALRAKAAEKGKPADDTKLSTLDAEADALRAELAAL